jgi:hypothetical protein
MHPAAAPPVSANVPHDTGEQDCTTAVENGSPEQSAPQLMATFPVPQEGAVVRVGHCDFVGIENPVQLA